MAPMTRRFSPGGIPGKDVAQYYRRRAEGGVGLIVTEGTYIASPGEGVQPLVPVFYTPPALAGWRHVVDEVHAAGGKLVPQLWHGGIVDVPSTTESVSVSVASAALLASTYAVAARRAEVLGFDGVEIHGGGKRTADLFRWVDEPAASSLGASGQPRRRLAVEIVRAIRSAVGPEFPLLFRFSEWCRTDGVTRLATSPEELSALLLPLADAGVDIFHVATDCYPLSAFPGSSDRLAQWTRRLGARPVIAGGGTAAFAVKNLTQPTECMIQPNLILEELASQVSTHQIDLIEVGRALLADPLWPRKVFSGQFGDIRPFHDDALRHLVM
jgi:2,4-dienoyl-CoA reductase-like NADH-dependent reductase (Old Yellow Enzyme family)